LHGIIVNRQGCCFSKREDPKHTLDFSPQPESRNTPCQSTSNLETLQPIPQDEFKTAPILELHVQESITFLNKEMFTINAYGMVESKRMTKNDGRVYIGKYNTRFTNDICMKDDESGVGDKHAMIYYLPSISLIRQKMLLSQGYGYGNWNLH